MKSEEKHIIWSNYDLDYEDWKDDLEENYPELSEQERITLMYEINGDYLEDERTNLNVQLSAPILVIGDLGLWYGRRMGYKEIASGKICDCLYSNTDYVDIFMYESEASEMIWQLLFAAADADMEVRDFHSRLQKGSLR